MNQRHAKTPRIAGWVAPGLALVRLLAACTPAPDPETEPATQLDLGDEVIITDFALAPPDARPDACYGKDVTPGVIEHVTERVLVAEAEIGPNGNILAPAQYEERATQKLVTGREPIFFETPCPPRWTPDFIASIQRALQTRGLYDGAVSGTLDAATRAAIREYQIARGLNSAILSTESARDLGLVEVDLPG